MHAYCLTAKIIQTRKIFCFRCDAHYKFHLQKHSASVVGSVIRYIFIIMMVTPKPQNPLHFKYFIIISGWFFLLLCSNPTWVVIVCVLGLWNLVFPIYLTRCLGNIQAIFGSQQLWVSDDMVLIERASLHLHALWLTLLSGKASLFYFPIRCEFLWILVNKLLFLGKS